MDGQQLRGAAVSHLARAESDTRARDDRRGRHGRVAHRRPDPGDSHHRSRAKARRRSEAVGGRRVQDDDRGRRQGRDELDRVRVQRSGGEPAPAGHRRQGSRGQPAALHREYQRARRRAGQRDRTEARPHRSPVASGGGAIGDQRRHRRHARARHAAPEPGDCGVAEDEHGVVIGRQHRSAIARPARRRSSGRIRARDGCPGGRKSRGRAHRHHRQRDAHRAGRQQPRRQRDSLQPAGRPRVHHARPLGIKWVFRRSAKGWFEAELNGPITS
jgi:hypothetical protein